MVVALPIAAWSAIDAPHTSTPALARVTDPSHEVDQPVPVRVIDAHMIAARRKLVRAHKEDAVRAAALAQAAQQRVAQRTAQWDELARCENAGHWHVVDRYGGGLGIYIGTWHAFGGDEFASNPGYATKEQQITVAERIYTRYGLSGWGCKVHMSWR